MSPIVRLIVLLAIIFASESRIVSSEAKSPPYFIKQPSNEEILLLGEDGDSSTGRSFKIPCEAFGDPKPDYFYTKNGKLFNWISGVDRITQEKGTGTLIISPFKTRDAGQYQCFAKNIWGIATSNFIFARIVELNSFNAEVPVQKEALEGQPFHLTCQSPGGYPKPSITWLIQDYAGGFKRIDDLRITVDPEGTLWFSSVSLNDEIEDSIYACAVTSYLNEVKMRAKVILRVTPMEEPSEKTAVAPVKQYTSQIEEIATVGKKARLYCIFGGTPLPNITWYKNNKLVQFQSGILSKDGGKSIEIKKTTTSDEGNYTCQVSNGVGHPISHTITLKVLVAPSFIKKPESVIIDEQKTAEFHCQATGNPAPEIIWIHNGKPLSEARFNSRRAYSFNSIIIEKLWKSDTGNYGCNATNSVGYVYQDAFVNVLENPYEVTATFVNTIREMLQRYDKRITKFPFTDSKREMKYFFNIEAEISSRLENISCLFYKRIRINALNYKKITGSVELLQYQAKNDISPRYVSAIVELKNVNIYLEKLPIMSKSTEPNTDDEFNLANATIMITEGTKGLGRDDRIAVGKQIFNSFVGEIKQQIIKTFRYNFQRMSDICQYPLNAITDRYQNYSAQRQTHYISIRADWNKTVTPFTSRFIELIINGSWDFKSLNAEYIDEKIHIFELQIENVAGSMKQIDDDSDSTKEVHLNYSMLYFSIIINQTNEVRVHVPESANFLVTSNNLSHYVDIAGIKGKFESSVASFLQSSINGSLNGDEHYRKLAERTVTEDLQKEKKISSKYDISSTFNRTFAEILLQIYGHLKNNVACQCQSGINYSSDFSLKLEGHEDFKKHQLFVENIMPSLVFPIAREEICNSANHFQIIYHSAGQVTGKIGSKLQLNCSLPFLVIIRDMKVIFENGSDNPQVEINNKSATVQLASSKTLVNCGTYSSIIESFKTTLVQPSISILKTNLKNRATSWYNAISNFCGRPKIIIKETGINPLEDPQTYYYKINNTIDYSSQRFLTYYMKIYGLLNFKSLYLNATASETIFEFNSINLTAKIVWNYLVDDFPLTKAKKTHLRIEKITLKGKINSITNELSITDESQLLVLDQENGTVRRHLEDTLKISVVESFQQSIKKVFDEIRKDYIF